MNKEIKKNMTKSVCVFEQFYDLEQFYEIERFYDSEQFLKVNSFF